MASSNLVVGLVMIGVALWVFKLGYSVVALLIGVVGALMLVK